MDRTENNQRSEVMSYNVGASDYSKHRIQPWDIWEEYQLNPWDADIVKRVLRTKQGEDRRMDYEKIIHICKKCIEMLDAKPNTFCAPDVEDVLPTNNRPTIPVQILLEEGGIMPKKATDGSAAYDLFAPDYIVIQPGRNVVPLNFRMALPKGIGATPNPRSGFTLKGFEGYRSWSSNIQSGTTGYPSSTGWTEYEPIGEPERMNADVQWGLIDMDYRGVCGVLVISRESRAFLLAKGTRFAQMCFQYYEEVDFTEVKQLDKTTRGDGGFNSTGTK